MRTLARLARTSIGAADRFHRRLSLSYILNRGWIDRETVAAPSSASLAASKSKSAAKKAEKAKADDAALSADEGGDDAEDSDFEDKEEEFEVKYNFRFEEPCVSSCHPLRAARRARH